MALNKLDRFTLLNYRYHLLFAFLIRVVFIIYGWHHDTVSTVPYTDVDYKVFTDASRHVLNSESPYSRHTYRYSPLIAILLIPNLLVHHTFGKFLFCVFDLLVAIIIQRIVSANLCCFELMKKDDVTSVNDLETIRIKNCRTINSQPNIAMILWLYNPMSIAISTRGNCDAIATFLVILTLYFLQCKKMYFVSGLIHGLSVYMRLYPLVYSLAMYVFLSDFSLYSIGYYNPRKSVPNIVNKSSLKLYLPYIIPNLKQIKLISGFSISFLSLIVISYLLYGYEFLYKTYLYHLIRKDIRHNFSLYFYFQYLAVSIRYESVWQKLLMVLPQLILLVILSIKYSLNKFSLNFSILTQTLVIVTFNSVLTSQYFVWIMGILPLCVWQIKMPFKTVFALMCIWIIAQIMWLLPAYYLEFKGQNTFFLIWIQCISFYCANIAILGRLIKHFTFV